MTMKNGDNYVASSVGLNVWHVHYEDGKRIRDNWFIPWSKCPEKLKEIAVVKKVRKVSKPNKPKFFEYHRGQLRFRKNTIGWTIQLWKLKLRYNKQGAYNGFTVEWGRHQIV